MTRALDHVRAMLPALAFLCAGVPLAALLERLGFFDAVSIAIERRWRRVPIGALWILAAVTTAALNLDTTVVLLTPLYIRLARRGGVDPLPVAAIALFLAAFASSVIPVSNLTTLIAADRLHLSVADVFTHLALPSLAAVAVGWWAFRRRHHVQLQPSAPGEIDQRALRVGSIVVLGLLVGFIGGPVVHLAPWMVAVIADLALVVITRFVPWRDVPLLTALGVAAIALMVALVLPDSALSGTLATDSAAGALGTTALGAVGANTINNLPALLVGVDASHAVTWGTWGWLLGVNVAAVVLPIGALANLLWRRILREEGIDTSTRRYLALTWPVALPAIVAATGVLVAERLVWR